MSKKVLLVADVSNLYYCARKKFNGRKLDYEKFLKKAVGENDLYRAIAYGAEINDEALVFKTALRHFGFETKYKTPRSYSTADSDREIRKADWDVGIAMDVVSMLGSVDIVVYGTADGDLTPSLEYVKFNGKQTHVLACGISRDLRNIADRYEEIGLDLLEQQR